MFIGHTKFYIKNLYKLSKKMYQSFKRRENNCEMYNIGLALQGSRLTISLEIEKKSSSKELHL